MKWLWINHWSLHHWTSRKVPNLIVELKRVRREDSGITAFTDNPLRVYHISACPESRDVATCIPDYPLRDVSLLPKSRASLLRAHCKWFGLSQLRLHFYDATCWVFSQHLVPSPLLRGYQHLGRQQKCWYSGYCLCHE